MEGQKKQGRQRSKQNLFDSYKDSIMNPVDYNYKENYFRLLLPVEHPVSDTGEIRQQGMKLNLGYPLCLQQGFTAGFI